MSRKTRSLIKGTSVIIAGVAVLLHMDILNVPSIAGYDFWILLIAFGLTLLVSR